MPRLPETTEAILLAITVIVTQEQEMAPSTIPATAITITGMLATIELPVILVAIVIITPILTATAIIVAATTETQTQRVIPEAIIPVDQAVTVRLVQAVLEADIEAPVEVVEVEVVADNPTPSHHKRFNR